jgi:hypothetical protein
MKSLRVFVLAALLLPAVAVAAWQPAYGELWDKATPFDTYLAGVKVREAQWKSRFANAAVDADILNEAKALPQKRRILVVAEDRCSDSAWAIPYIAKLAAVVPEKLDVRVLTRAQGGTSIQSQHLTPDGRLATPTVVILDEENRVIGGWVERPAALQKWYIANKATMESGPLHEYMDEWYTKDAGKSTLREVLEILKRTPGGR